MIMKIVIGGHIQLMVDIMDIVYFNDDDEHGTCFYEELVEKPDVPEHYQPWGAKKDFISY